jgi:hypothetical protein
VVENLLQLNALVGNRPEINPIVNASSGVTAKLSNQLVVTANYTNRSLNASVTVAGGAALPTPKVGLGLQVNKNSTAITNTGAWQYNPHRTGMLYNYIASIFINNQAPLALDGLALGPTNLISAARTTYDSSLNNLQMYFNKYHRVHGRYPMTGVYEWDLERGDYPPIASLTPFVAAMTPSDTYAALVGIQPTPAMATFYKVGSSVTLSSAYVVDYSLGLVEVAY